MGKRLNRLFSVTGFVGLAILISFLATNTGETQQKKLGKARQEGQLSVINYLRGMGSEKDFHYFDKDSNKVYVPVGSIASSIGEELDNSSNLDSLLSSYQNTYNSNSK